VSETVVTYKNNTPAFLKVTPAKLWDDLGPALFFLGGLLPVVVFLLVLVPILGLVDFLFIPGGTPNGLDTPLEKLATMIGVSLYGLYPLWYFAHRAARTITVDETPEGMKRLVRQYEKLDDELRAELAPVLQLAWNFHADDNMYGLRRCEDIIYGAEAAQRERQHARHRHEADREELKVAEKFVRTGYPLETRSLFRKQLER
jgi:hypothetical protein